MTSAEFATIGFAAPPRERGRRAFARVRLIATVALVLSIAVAAAAVSVAKPDGGCAIAPVTAKISAGEAR